MSKNDLSGWFGPSEVPLGQVQTPWSRILAARAESPEGQGELRRLAERYYGPIYRTLRCRGLAADAAMEMTQRFMVPFCEGKFVRLADQSRGSFRAFLKTALRHFLLDEGEKEHRRRGTPIEAVDPAGAGAAPEEELDRQIAWDLLEEARSAVRARLADDPQAWEAFVRHDLEPPEEAGRGHEALAAALGMDLGRFRRALYRARAVFQEEVCRQLGDGIADGAELSREVAWFLDAIRRGPPARSAD